MNVDEMRARLAEIETNFRHYARDLAEEQLAHWSPKGISDLSDSEFVDQVTEEIYQLISREDVIVPPPDERRTVNLFGYGTVQEVLTEVDLDTATFTSHGYLWGHEVAAALGWDPADFHDWVGREWNADLVEQRAHDVETGTVGWEHVYHHPMRVDVWQGDGASADHCDASGTMRGPIMRYWADLWLVSTHRVLAIMSASPWGKEWREQVKPLMSHAFRESGLEALFEAVTTYRTREDSLGEVTTEADGTLADAIAEDRDGISPEEARDRAFRGPVPPEEV